MRALAIVALLLFPGCVGGEPRRPVPPPHGGVPEDDGEGLTPTRREEDDRFSIDGALPRSGDPAHPNVKVELTVVDVVSREGLAVRGGVRGSIVRGTVDLRASLAASGGRVRSRSRTATFTVVQAGRSASLALTDDARGICGPYAGIRVFVAAATPDMVELAVLPFTSPAAVEGQTIEGAARVRVRPGESVVLGGYSESRQRSRRGLSGVDEEEGSRELLCVLSVKVIG